MFNLTLLTQIDALKARLDRLRPLPPDLVENLREVYNIRLTYHSNAIEGNTLTQIEFICALGSDYRKLRNAISDRNPRILLKDNSGLEIERFTADQYGIRMAIIVNEIPIKTEIIAEARFELDSPRQPIWSPVECLSVSDCFTSKLLANADRYNDPSVHSRDLIDLAFLRNERSIPDLAILS